MLIRGKGVEKFGQSSKIYIASGYTAVGAHGVESTHTHTHMRTHTHIYIYIYIYVCVCVCVYMYV